MKNSKKISVGTWMQIKNHETLNLIKGNGFEWIVFDLEHGNFSIEDLAILSQLAKLNNLIPLCRLSKPCQDEAMLVLEKGVQGIIFPRVTNEIECKKLVNCCFYPPIGFRGVGFSSSNRFGKTLSENLKNFKPIIIMMIENVTACKNLDKILKIKNLSGIFVGPYDLSASLGVVGDFESKVFKRNIDKIIKCTDAVMVARGDLGVELPPSNVPGIQKNIIN